MSDNLAQWLPTPPPGFRFRPTKKERINHFLKAKNTGFHHLVDGLIPTVDLLAREPQDLPYKRDFFSLRDRLHGKGEQYKRKTKTGHWKSTCKDKDIIDKDSGECIGKMKTLVFHTDSKKRTYWIMYEYSHFGSLPNQSGDYVINVLKKKKTKKDKVDTPESSEGHLEIHGQTEISHQWRSFSQSPDSLFPHGGKVPEAPTATQVFDDLAKLDLELQLDCNDWLQHSTKLDLELLQLPNMPLDFTD